MEITKTKMAGRFYIHIRHKGEILHEQACDYDMVDYYVNMYNSLFRLWKTEQSKAVLNRWATFQWLCTHMEFPMETGAHASIFSLVNADVYSS